MVQNQAKKQFSVFAILFVLLFGLCQAQEPVINNSERSLELSSNDSLNYVILDSLATAYAEISPASSYYYASKSAELTRKLGFKLHQATAEGKMGYAQLNLGNYPKSLQLFLSALEIANDQENEHSMLPEHYRKMLVGFSRYMDKDYAKVVQSFLYFFLGILYENMNQFDKELAILDKAIILGEETKDTLSLGNIYYVLGRVYLAKQMPDSAIFFEEKARSLFQHFPEYDPSGVDLNIGKSWLAKGDFQKATPYLQNAYLLSGASKYLRGQIAAALLLAEISLKQGKPDSALHLSAHALDIAKNLKVPELLLRTYTSLASVYTARMQFDSASKYQALIIKLKDSVFNSKQAQQFQNIEADQFQRQQEIESAKKDYHARTRVYGLIIGIIVTLGAALLLWKNNIDRGKAYVQLKKQKQETDFQKAKVEETLEELKITQAQLVQREKMASLGELTAGIAHEIQNPLNFVKNFSEVNHELGIELNEAIDKGNLEQARKLSQDIAQNLGKIIHHGQRADGIVKGMMLYALAREGRKEITDIHDLIGECLRITYHGFESGHKGFHAHIRTSFDAGLPMIDLIRIDMSRVFSNLFNNSFYALDEKSRKLGSSPGGVFEPVLDLRTSVIIPNDSKPEIKMAEIRIRDNGLGIPEKSIGKIFQPFFTLKPSGQGTGLGLSLSYDIITKEHHGTIEVLSQEGEYAEFVIRLPMA